MSADFFIELGKIMIELLFGKDWVEEQKARGEDYWPLGALAMSGLILWLLFTMFIWVDFTTDLLVNLGVVIGYPAIMAYATVRTRRRMKEKAAAREKEKAENPPSDEETH